MSEEKRKRLPVSVSTAIFIEDQEGKLLLLQQEAEWKGKKWGPPAEGMHAHENPLDTALREVNEEIGIKVELTDIIGIYTVDRGEEATGIAFVFRGKIISGEINPRKGEIMNYRFFTPSEIEQLIKENGLYKPEYNIAGINDWLKGSSYPLEIVKTLGASTI